MFVVSRDILESLIIDEQIEVTVLAIHGGRVQIGITAPASVRIFRSELEARMALSGRRGAQASLASESASGAALVEGSEDEVNPLTGSRWVKTGGS